MIHVVCVKHGTKYNSDYVNRLYRMVKKNVSLPFSFMCFTDDNRGLHKDINVISLDASLYLDSYWWKFSVLQSKHYEKNNKVLYLDLDVIIQNPLDDLFEKIVPNKIVGVYMEQSESLLNHERKEGKYITKLNSSIMLFNAHEVNDIAERFLENSDYNILKYYGMCRYLYNVEYNRLEFNLEFKKDWYMFIKYPHNEDPIDRKKYSFSFDGWECFYFPSSKICIMNTVDQLTDQEEVLKRFSFYYK